MRKPILLIALVIAAMSAALPNTHAQNCTYTVQPGDSVASIAAQFGLMPWELQELNQEQYDIWNTLRPGWVLTVPCTGGEQPPADDGGEEPPVEQPPAIVTATPTLNMNVRSGPSTAYPVIDTAFQGETLPVVARNEAANWVLFDTGTRRGWIAAWLVNLNGDINTLPVSTEIIGGGEAPPADEPPSPPAAPTPTAPPPPPPSGGGGAFELGGQTHTLANPDTMRAAGMRWVKFQHKWTPADDPNAVAGRIQLAHSQGFRVLFSIPGPLYPSSIDFAAYTEFVRGVAALGADGIEVWNEMNLSREWPAGQISPASYVNDMLAPAYRAIKAANPNTLVVSGAPAPTGVNDGFSVMSDDLYVAGMAAAGAANYMDCVGLHYNAGATPPDVSTGHPADSGAGHYSWYFLPTYNVYASAFPGTPLCYTEIGYVSPDGYPPIAPNFWWGGGNSVAEQADWLGRSAQIARGTGNVRLFIVFNVDLTYYSDTDPQAGYAILRPDGSCPACAALAAAQ